MSVSEHTRKLKLKYIIRKRVKKIMYTVEMLVSISPNLDNANSILKYAAVMEKGYGYLQIYTRFAIQIQTGLDSKQKFNLNKVST